MAHIFHREIRNERDPNREEGHDHKANYRKNGYEQIHGSPPGRLAGLMSLYTQARHGPLGKHNKIKHPSGGVRTLVRE